MPYKRVKQATGYDKKKIRVGDKVLCISYEKKPMNEVTVLDMWHQGMDGIIIKTDVPPNSNYPHHFYHRASLTVLSN